MTLSDTSMQKYLKKRFVAAWVNLEGDTAAGGSFAHAPEDGAGTCMRGNGRANLQILALTPDGRILHAIAGYVGPEDLRGELDWALETYALMKKTPTLESAMVAERALDHVARPELLSKPDLRRSKDVLERLRDALPEDEFARVEKRLRTQGRRDMQFVAENPLMPIARFRTSMLTGGGASFFGSKTGKQSGGTIGNTEGPAGFSEEQLERMRDEIRRRAGPSPDDA